jgi:hypothetical protein
MKTIGTILLMAAVLASGSGCVARPDWIERTLVTVDVTGVWYGREVRQGNPPNVGLWLDLQQEGPRAKGSARLDVGLSGFSGLIEGTIAGDVFSFRQSNATQMKGQLTVRGDEMTGEVVIEGGTFTHRIVLLRRVGPSSRPDSPPRE